MKKDNCLHMLKGISALLLTIMSTVCFAQKSVTYTFTGRNASSITGTTSKPLGLYVSAGTAPKGVSIDNITGISSDESENGIDNVDIGNTVGISLIPQYLVRPGEEGVITFKNFLYEIAGINWTSRSQVPLLTSKTSTWAVKGDGSSTTSTLTKEWDSNTYETSSFVTDKDFAGISALHISCETTQALHGHSMKDFIISYYEPEITISCDNELALGSKSTTVSASITNRKGAFTDDMLSLSYSDVDASVATISGNTITSGTTSGSVLVTATLTYDGTVIATATKRVQIGNQDFNFIPGELYCEYLKNTDPDNVYAWYKLYTSEYNTNNFTLDNSGLRLSSQTPKSGDNDTNYWWTSTSNYASNYTNSSYASSGQITQIGQSTKCGYFRACMQPIDYQEFVPAYTTASVEIQFTLSSTRTSYQTGALIPGLAKAGFLSAIYCFGDDKWPDGETTKTSSTYRYFSTNITSDQTGTSDREPLIAKSNYSSDLGSPVTSTGTTNSKTFSFSNTGNSDGYVDQMKTQQLGAFSFVKYAARNTTISSSFGYTNRSKTITYYLYINYDNNGGSGEMGTTTGTCLSTTTDYETATTAIATNTFTRDEDGEYTYQFTGWNTKADGTGTAYQSGDGINIYDKANRCGAGPITLYAQWKTVRKAIATDPSEDDNVYSLWGNGGTINGEEVVAAQFVLGTEVDNVTVPTRKGYTFNGYYTSTTGGTQIFNASGEAVGDGSIISSTNVKRWMAENDVYLYAQWTENPSDPVTTITVTLNANGGTPSTSTITCTEGSSENCNIATQTPTRDGYKFTGWYTSSAGNADGDIMVYNANGEAVYAESYSTDSEGNITPVYTALNPTFFDTSGKYVGEAAPFNANFTIYAHWIANTTTMTFDEGGTDASASWEVGINTGDFSSTPTYDEVEYNSVTITRALKANHWNTVCFPFNVDKTQVENLFSDVEMFNGLEIDGTTAKMQFQKCDVMMPGVPYFVKINSSSNLSDISVSNATVTKTPSPISITNGNTTVEMIGEFNTHLEIESGALILLNDKFYVSGGTYNGKKVTGNNKGFRCYFKNTTTSLSGETKEYNLLGTSIDLEGYDGYSGTDGLEQVEITPDNCTFSIAPTEIYDLCGRKFTGKPEKGVYITNGKKYIAR